MQPQRHGGDLNEAAARYAIASGRWLDLSTGINPVPYPAKPVSPDAWQKLPQADAEAALLSAARRAYDVPDNLAVVAVPGTQAAIQRMPRLATEGPAAILSPTYGEHAPVWRRAGFDVTENHDIRACLASPNAVLVNPNNPDGIAHDPGGLLSDQAAKGGLLVIDEAFADVLPDASAISHIRKENVAILRSFGKFFGLAGLRLGFVVTQPHLADRLAEDVGPWAVSGPALEIGRQALEDKDWIAATRRELAKRAANLDDLLKENGLSPTGEVSLFRLIRHQNAGEIHKALAAGGIWTRAFDHEPAWLRLGLPATDADFDRLADALASIGALLQPVAS